MVIVVKLSLSLESFLFTGMTLTVLITDLDLGISSHLYDIYNISFLWVYSDIFFKEIL